MNREPESMLAVDVGNAYARATLIDRVGDMHRFIARGVAPQIAATNPSASIGVALQRAVQELESLSGRRLIGADGLPIMPEDFGSGVDAVGGTVSALGVMRAALVSLREDRSLHLAEAALRAVPSKVVGRITGREIASRSDAFEQFAQSLRDAPPHIVLLVGGTDRKPDKVIVTMAEALVVALSLLRPQERPVLVYAGPQSFRPSVAAITAERIRASMVDNVSPDDRQANLAPLRKELDDLYVNLLGSARPGLDVVRGWCGGHVLTVGRAMLNAYTHRGVDVLAADVGALNSVIVRSGLGQVLVEPECGVGQGARAVLDRAGAVAIRAWLTADVSEEEVNRWVLNKELRPWVRCTSPEECAIEMAFAREALHQAATAAVASWQDGQGIGGSLPRTDTVVGGGAVLGGGRSAEAAGALIDGLQPVGVCRLALDSGELVPSLGAVAELNPAAVRGVLDRDAIVVLGTLIAPIGPAKGGRTAIKVDIQMPGNQSMSIEVAVGSLVRLPLAAGVKARAVLRPTKPHDVVVGSPGQGMEVEVEGGPLGVIIDARGRPLPDLQRMVGRTDQLRQWAAALGA
ncbi:MAG: glutamate mutase L [Anaerolineae bacterium]